MPSRSNQKWVRPPGPGDLRPGEVVIEIRRKTSRRLPDRKTLEFSRTLQMQRSEPDRYLIELLEPATWIEGIRHLLADRRTEGKLWPHYRTKIASGSDTRLFHDHAKYLPKHRGPASFDQVTHARSPV